MTTERDKLIAELRAGWRVSRDESAELARLDTLCFDAADMLAADGAQGEPIGFSQFLTDVTTAAGLLEHGKQSKGLASRIGDGAVKYRALLAKGGAK